MRDTDCFIRLVRNERRFATQLDAADRSGNAVSPLDGAGMLPDISEAAPAGDDLEHDDAFSELERAARGKPERQSGDTLEAAEDPDWLVIEAQAQALSARTLDLRVLSHLAVARLQTGGIAAFGETLALIRNVLDQRWDHVHPVLDADDDNDPMVRANALLALAHPIRVLRPLRDLALARPARAGPLSWRDIGVATGVIQAPDIRQKLTEDVVRSAFQDCDRARLVATREAVDFAIKGAAGISAVFDNKAGFGTGPNLTELIKLLREMARYMERYTPGGDEEASAGVTDKDEGVVETKQTRAMSSMTAASLTSITNRVDALHVLDLAADYFRRCEPSSPLPFLLDRARRLADKNFLDILRDMAPQGLDQAQTVVGKAEQENQNTNQNQW